MAGYMKDLGSGKFQFEVSAGRDGKGKRKKAYKTVTITGSTPEAILKKAEKQLAIFVGEVEKGDNQAPTHYTFSSYVEEWKKNAQRTLAAKTYYRYCELLRLHILPEIGSHKLESISPVILENAYNELRKVQKREYVKKDGKKTVTEYTLSEQTIKHIHRLIGTIMQTAFRKGLIKENPIARTEAPKVEKKEAKSYNDEQIASLFEALESTDLQFKACIHTAINTGARLGEIMGLTWECIDFKNCTIEIKQANQYLPGVGIFTKAPKNESSKRIVPVPKELISLLEQLRHEQKIRRVELGNKWKGKQFDESQEATGSLFTQADGSPMFPDVPSKWLRKFLKKNNLPPLPFHGLRHTAATYLIGQGEDMVTVSKMLGHARPSTTSDIYSHTFKKRSVEAASKMSMLYHKKEKDIITK